MAGFAQTAGIRRAALDTVRRTARPASRTRHAVPDEIVDIGTAISRLDRLAETGLLSTPAATPAHEQGSTPSSAPSSATATQRINPAAPVDLGVWSDREARRFLETMTSIRHDGAATGTEGIPTAIAQWLDAGDGIVAAGNGAAWRIAVEKRLSPKIVDAGAVALEAALGAQRTERPGLVVAVLGGSASAAAGHRDAFLLAARRKLPVLFVAESGVQAGDRRFDPRSPGSALGRLATARGLDAAAVDGGDVIALSEAAGDLIHHIRCGGGPGYIDAMVAATDAPGDAPGDDSDPIVRLHRAMQVRAG